MRDLVMKKTPKDFDIITSADLREVYPCFFFFIKLDSIVKFGIISNL